MLAFTGLRGFFNWRAFHYLVCFFLVGVSFVFKRIEEEAVGSGSPEEEEATGSDREDCQSGRGRKRRRDPDADGEGPIAGRREGGIPKRRGLSDRNRTATAGFGGSSSFGALAPSAASASAAAGRLLRLGTADRSTPAASPLTRRQFAGATNHE